MKDSDKGLLFPLVVMAVLLALAVWTIRGEHRAREDHCTKLYHASRTHSDTIVVAASSRQCDRFLPSLQP